MLPCCRWQSIARADRRGDPGAAEPPAPDAAFPHSLGVHSGPPERVEIVFEPAVGDYVRAREWHPSQQVRDAESGRLSMTLNVCLDRALQSWILSFGPFTRVVAPEKLAREIAEQLSEATARYAS